MIILNPVTFQQIIVDEEKVTAENAELLKQMSRMTRRINRLEAERNLCIMALEKNTAMKFPDILSKVTMKSHKR